MIAARRPDESEVYRLLASMNPEAFIARGFEDAYIGHSAGGFPVAVYDFETCVEIVMVEKCVSRDQAIEYLEDHTVPDELTPNLPVFVVKK